MGLLDDATWCALERSLDTAALRQRTIAHNMANIDTPGFKRSTVSFEESLDAALNASVDPEERAYQVSQTTPEVTTVEGSLRLDGNNVDIDLEAAELAENSLRYEAITRAMSARLKLLRTAINGGTG